MKFEFVGDRHYQRNFYRITISHEYAGHIDFWQGNSKRWENNAACLFCPYTSKTTYKEAVETFFEDYLIGWECDNFPEKITDDMIKDVLNHQLGNSEKLIEPAKYLNEANDDTIDTHESPVWIILLEVEKLTE